jgi:hypothetical protein
VGKYLNYLDAKNAARLVSPFHWDKHATVAPPTLAVAGGRGDAAAKQGGQAWHPTFSSWTLGVMSLPSPPPPFCNVAVFAPLDSFRPIPRGWPVRAADGGGGPRS